MHEVRNAYRILASNIERKSPLRRPRYLWDKKSKVDSKEILFEDVN
jgi:hypothetical protein